MNWTGGRRARASKTANGPLHRQKQYFARIRAAQTTAAYSAASNASSPNHNHHEDDVSPASPVRKRPRPMPELEILRNQPSKQLMSTSSFALDDEGPSLKKPATSSFDRKSRMRRLLKMGDWVGTRKSKEAASREEEIAGVGRSVFMERRTPAARSPSRVPSVPSASAIHSLRIEPRHVAPTVFTAASRDYGHSQLQPLSQGGYIRIGKTTLPPPLPMLESPRPTSTNRSKNAEGTSQESMLLDYEERGRENSNTTTTPVNEDDDDFDENGEFDPWDRSGDKTPDVCSPVPGDDRELSLFEDTENLQVASPPPGSFISSSSIATKGDSDIFACRRNPSSPPSARELFIRGNLALGGTPFGHEHTPSSPTRINVRRSCQDTTPATPEHPPSITLDDDDLPLEDQWRDFISITEDVNIDSQIGLEREMEGDPVATIDGKQDSEIHSSAISTFKVMEGESEGLYNLPTLRSKARKKREDILSLRTDGEERTCVRDDNEAWLSFIAPELIHSPVPCLRKSSSPKLPDLTFTAAEDRSWRSFVFASSLPSDEEEGRVIAEESGRLAKRDEDRKDSTSEISTAISGKAEAGSSSAGSIGSSTYGGGGIRDVVRINSSEVADSIVAMSGTEVEHGVRSGRLHRAGFNVWKPPKRFTGDKHRVHGLEKEGMVEDIEDW